MSSETTTGTAGSRAVLLIVSLAAFMAFLDTTIANIAFPALQTAFRAKSSASVSWVLNAYNIVFAALLIPAGQLADRHSRRRLFLGGLAVFALASGACAIAPSLGALIACRAIQAAGAAVVIPTGIALALPAFPEQQIKAIALIAGVSGVAFAAGPSIGGSLIDTVGWRGIFLVNVPIGALALLLGYRLIGVDRRRPTHDARRPDVAGSVLLLLGTGSLALAIVQGNAWGWGSARILAAFMAAGCLAGTALLRATRHPLPAIELDLFRAPGYTVANVAVFAFAIGLAAKLLCDVLFMTSVWHYSELRTGLAVSASPLLTAATAAPAARLAIRIGTGLAATLGGALYAGGCLWYATRMGSQPRYLSSYLPGTALTGIGIALILPTLTSAALLALPSSRLAAGAGINAMIRQLGAALGVALFVAIIGSPAPAAAVAAFHRGWAFAAGASAIAALAAVALRRTATARAGSLAR